MIESFYWKQDLLKLNRRIKKIKLKHYASDFDKKITILEKDIILAFLIIRRLLESKTKLTQKLYKNKYSLVRFNAFGKTHHTLLNNHDLERHFNFDKPEKINKDLNFICNQFLHHYTSFLIIGENHSLSHIYLTSDFEKDNYLYKISEDILSKVLLDVGNDVVTSTKMVFNYRKRDYDVINE